MSSPLKPKHEDDESVDESSSGCEDPETNNASSEEELKLDLARKETTQVFRLRLLVFFVLLLAAGKFVG
jgi:hypothetical protein